MKSECLLLKTGRVDYLCAYELQKKLLEEKISGGKRDFLILSEHEPVITLGRGFKENSLLLGKDALAERGISVYEIERGGGATYHGPGQLVGYPVFDLAGRGKDLRVFINNIEEVIIRTLGDFGIGAERKDTGIGVWTGEKKIASVGVAVRKWIAYHGFALNISPEMENFSFINPCGLDYNVMTSMERILSRRTAPEDVEERVAAHFMDVFSVDFILSEGEKGNA